MGNPIPASAFSSSLQPNQQQDENKELAALAKSIHADSTEENLYRLTELTVKWVIANPQPIKLKQVNYQRQQNKTGVSFKRHHRATQKGNTWQVIQRRQSCVNKSYLGIYQTETSPLKRLAFCKDYLHFLTLPDLTK